MNLLAEHNRDVLHDILEKAAADKSAMPGTPEQKIGDFYASCMDSPKIDAAGFIRWMTSWRALQRSRTANRSKTKRRTCRVWVSE